MKIKVLHIIKYLGRGGPEIVLQEIIKFNWKFKLLKINDLYKK